MVIGGGLAGVLCAAALQRADPQQAVLVVEQGPRLGGNHRWSWFDSDLNARGHGLLAGIARSHWPRHEVRFPKFTRLMENGYNSITSADLHDWASQLLRPDQLLLGAQVNSLDAGGAVLGDGRRISADRVLDARGPGSTAGMAVGWQKFAGFELDVPGHGLTHPIIMDARVRQHDGYRFVYTLPLSPDRLFIEDTFYSDGPEIDLAALREAVRRYAAEFGVPGAEHGFETGALPIVIAGDPQAIWPADAMADAAPAGMPGVARVGMAGGFFHHTTGYSLPLAVGNALAFADALTFTDTLFGGDAPDADWWRRRFLQHWRDQGYFRLLNTMLFRAAEPDLRYRVFQHFYRLPDGLVQRFYAGKPKLADQLRIVTGRPPVPVTRAIRALMAGKDKT